MRWFVILVSGLCIMLAGGCRNQQAASSTDKVRVVATIFPIADVARQIGGQHVEVTSLMPPGQNPHAFNPRPADAEALRQAALMITVGMGIDEWSSRAVQMARRNDIKVLTLTDDADFRAAKAQLDQAVPAASEPANEDHDEHDVDKGEEHEGHHHHGGDPHVWLDPVFMQTFVREIAAAFSQADPAHAADYARNAEAYIGQLKQLDAEYREQLTAAKGKTFVTFHEAFSYIARRYGLCGLALHDADAAGLGTQRWQEIKQQIAEGKARAVFAEPQFDQRKLEELTRGTNIQIRRLDPEGTPYNSDYNSYLNMMRTNLRNLVEGLK